MAVEGDSELRYRRLFDRYHTAVYAYCRRRTDAETAADCVAETFLVAWRRLDVVPDGEATLGWLYSVARKTLANELRRVRRSRSLQTRLRGLAAEDAPADPGPDAQVVMRERDRTMVAALEQLRPQDREVLRLAWWEELPHGQIASMLGCSTDAVNHRIQRAARRAAREFQRIEHRHRRVGTAPHRAGGET